MRKALQFIGRPDKTASASLSRNRSFKEVPTSHADDLVVVYLPKERLLIEADPISPRNGQVRPGSRVKEFVQELDKLNLDVATIVGIHGDQASLEAARAAAKK